jgi:hypothetical protein
MGKKLPQTQYDPMQALEKSLTSEAIGSLAGRALAAGLTAPGGGAVASLAEHIGTKLVRPLAEKLNPKVSRSYHVKKSAALGQIYSMRGNDGKPHNFRMASSAAAPKGDLAHHGMSFFHEQQPGESPQEPIWMSHKDFIDKKERGEIREAAPGQGPRTEWIPKNKNTHSPRRHNIVVPGEGKKSVVPKGIRVVHKGENITEQDGEPLEKSADLVNHLATHLAMYGPAIAAQVQDAVHHLAAAHIGNEAAHAAAALGHEALHGVGEKVHEYANPGGLAGEAARYGSYEVGRRVLHAGATNTQNKVAKMAGHEEYHVPVHEEEGSAKVGHDYIVHGDDNQVRRYHAHASFPTHVHMEPKPFETSADKEYPGMIMKHEDIKAKMAAHKMHDLGEVSDKAEKSQVDGDADLVKSDGKPELADLSGADGQHEEAIAASPVPDVPAKYVVQVNDSVMDLRGQKYVAAVIEHDLVTIRKDDQDITITTIADWNRFATSPGMTLRRDGRSLPLA